MDWMALIKRLTDRGWLQTQIAVRVGAQQSTISELGSGNIKEPRYTLAKALIDLDASKERPPKVAEPAKAA